MTKPNENLPCLQDVVRNWFFKQNLAVNAVAFAIDEAHNNKCVVRFAIGKIVDEVPYLFTHIGHIDQEVIQDFNGLLVVDLTATEDAMTVIDPIINGAEDIGFLTDAFGNRHYFSSAVGVGYNPEDRPNAQPMLIGLSGYEDHLLTNEGVWPIEDGITEYRTRFN